MFKTCLQCGTEFKTYQRTVNHCSRECAINAIRKTERRECANCGKPFERQPNRQSAETVFCSRDCHADYRAKAARTADCPVCGVTFKHPNNTYCSTACKDVAARKGAVVACDQCGTLFASFPSAIVKGRRFCTRECTVTYMTGKNSPHWRGGKCQSHGRYWAYIRGLVLSRDKVCQNCGAAHSPSGRTLDVHHIDPRRNYDNQDEANILSNLVALCASCHIQLEMAVTHNHLDRLPTRLRVLASVQ
jgi:hypothetical protein